MFTVVEVMADGSRQTLLATDSQDEARAEVLGRLRDDKAAGYRTEYTGTVYDSNNHFVKEYFIEAR